MTVTFLDAVHTDPWGESFIDLPTLNAKASDAILAEIGKVRAQARSGPRSLRSSSLVVLGPPGAGKTHLFARLRRRLGPRAVFVLVRPLVHAPMTPRFVLGEIVKQLGRANDGHTQLQSLVGSLLAHLVGVPDFPSAFLSDWALLDHTERAERLDAAVEQVVEMWEDVDDSYLRRLLQAPFEPAVTQRALLAWLSGKDCDESQLARIGATASLSEERSVAALQTLCAVAALGAPITLVFDQLENLIDGNEPGQRLLGYANLAAELVDSMRGLVLVHMALDTEWSRGIEPSLNLSQRSRLIMKRETLSLPSASERDELLRLWVNQVPERQGPYPWPFSEAGLATLLKVPGATPRMLMVECRKALNGEAELEAAAVVPEEEQERTVDAFADEWARRLEAAREVLREADEQRTCVDAARLADGILAAGRFLESMKLSSSTAGEPLHVAIEAAGASAQVAILSQGHHKSLGAALTRLVAHARSSSVVAIRERSRDLPPTWKDTTAKKAALVASPLARWLWLEPEDAARLLALDALLQGARSGDVTNSSGAPAELPAVEQWVRSSLAVQEWEIVRALGGTQSSRAESPDSGEEGGARRVAPPAAASVALTILRQLGLASLDRLVREVARVEPTSTRSAVLEELKACRDVKFFGRSIVCVRVAP